MDANACRQHTPAAKPLALRVFHVEPPPRTGTVAMLAKLRNGREAKGWRPFTLRPVYRATVIPDWGGGKHRTQKKPRGETGLGRMTALPVGGYRPPVATESNAGRTKPPYTIAHAAA